MKRKARLVPASEYGLTAAPGMGSRRAMAHLAEEMLVQAAPAMRRLRMFRPG